jgi:hypothetical protein
LRLPLSARRRATLLLALPELDSVLRWLNPALHPVIVMGPDDVIRSF